MSNSLRGPLLSGVGFGTTARRAQPARHRIQSELKSRITLSRRHARLSFGGGTLSSGARSNASMEKACSCSRRAGHGRQERGLAWPARR